MLTASGDSCYTLEQSLSPDDQATFALFLQYPEIDFASYEIHSDDENGSGPAGTLPDDSSQSEESTLIAEHEGRSPPFSLASILEHSITPHLRTTEQIWQSLQSLLDSFNLPARTITYFKSLAQTIQNLAAEIIATVRPRKESDIPHLGAWLIKSIKYSAEQADLQANKVESMKSLVAFNTSPPSKFIHSTLQQRARLTTTQLALPCRQELDFIQRLIDYFYSSIFNEFLAGSSLGLFDQSTCNVINNVYLSLMTWMQNYKRWCTEMKDLRQVYLQPLIQRYRSDKEAQQEATKLGNCLRLAEVSLSNLEKLQNDIGNNAAVQVTRSQLGREKQRYRREHTL